MNHRSRALFFCAALALFFARLPAAAAKAAPAGHGDDQVTVFSDNIVAAGDLIDGNAVAVFGHLTVDGEVKGVAVAVMGGNTINGTVHGQVVAVMGNLTLGPDAQVDGDVICVAGTLHRFPGSRVGGHVMRRGFHAGYLVFPALRTVFLDGIHSRWAWLANLLILSIYALAALVFPRGIRACGETLVERPGLSILSAVLTFLALPFLFFLLLVSIIGIPVAIIVLPAGVIGLMMFGKASFYWLVGRAISCDKLPPAPAVFAGGLLCLLFFLIPVAGLILSLLVSMLMIGSVVVALFTAGRKPVPAFGPVGPAGHAALSPGASTKPAGPVASPSPLEAADVPLVTAPTVPHPLDAGSSPSIVPPVLDGATLPRAGFWIRTLALLIDTVLVSAVFHVFGAFCFLLLAAYGAIMWKLKGTTVGGIICGLRVVRLDGRPIDWSTAIARAAGCFLSMLVFNLGFIWVAFDGQRQSWHDKIAGTTVVHAPKGTSLV